MSGCWLRTLLKQLREKVATTLLTAGLIWDIVSRYSSATDLLPDLEQILSLHAYGLSHI